MNTEEANILRKQLVENYHSVKMTASGYSMFPFLRNGDRLTVTSFPLEKIQVGDIAVFEQKNLWIPHRVIAIANKNNETILLLRGDTCIQMDLPVTKKNYIGKIQYFERKEKEYSVDSFQKRGRIIVKLGTLRVRILSVIKILAIRLKNF